MVGQQPHVAPHLAHDGGDRQSISGAMGMIRGDDQWALSRHSREVFRRTIHADPEQSQSQFREALWRLVIDALVQGAERGRIHQPGQKGPRDRLDRAAEEGA